jgi:dienelactone hydrolase
MSEPIIRAIFRSVRIDGLIAPNDTAHLKIHYQADFNNTEPERNTGLLPASSGGAPFPVVILLPGINVGPEGLGWLACALSRRGMVVVTYSLIGEELPGQISLTPGIDIMALAPDSYGTRPSALAIGPIIHDLRACHETGVLAGLLDLTRIALGGHSAGGTVALLNANPDWFPGVCAGFAYAAHTAAATMLGHPPGIMNAISDKAPVLIMGGTNDGVIAASAGRYGDPEGDATGRVIATFDHAVSRTKGDSILAIIDGANHFSVVSSDDQSTGRAFLDGIDTASEPRKLIENLTWAFLASAFDFDKITISRAWCRIDEFRNAFSIWRQK